MARTRKPLLILLTWVLFWAAPTLAQEPLGAPNGWSADGERYLTCDRCKTRKSRDHVLWGLGLSPGAPSSVLPFIGYDELRERFAAAKGVSPPRSPLDRHNSIRRVLLDHDPARGGSTTLVVAMKDTATGAPFRGRIQLVQRGTPANELFSHGDRLVDIATTSDGYKVWLHIQPGWYQVIVLNAERSSPLSLPFEVAGERVRQRIDVKRPEPMPLRVRLLDTDGRRIKSVWAAWSLTATFSTEPILPANWMRRERRVGTHGCPHESDGTAHPQWPSATPPKPMIVKQPEGGWKLEDVFTPSRTSSCCLVLKATRLEDGTGPRERPAMRAYVELRTPSDATLVLPTREELGKVMKCCGFGVAADSLEQATVSLLPPQEPTANPDRFWTRAVIRVSHPSLAAGLPVYWRPGTGEWALGAARSEVPTEWSRVPPPGR